MSLPPPTIRTLARPANRLGTITERAARYGMTAMTAAEGAEAVALRVRQAASGLLAS
jgi:hypothetical protein